jgi:transcriptional antiterminator Rof (Rho-off)
MRAVNFADALQREKFTPFELCLDSGKIIQVKHSDCVLFSENKSVAVVAEGEHLHIVDLDHIANLSLKQE